MNYANGTNLTINTSSVVFGHWLSWMSLFCWISYVSIDSNQKPSVDTICVDTDSSARLWVCWQYWFQGTSILLYVQIRYHNC